MRHLNSIALLTLTLSAGTLWCQEFRATLTGRVVDPSDAPIAGASITVKNEATNVASETRTDSRGNYTVPFLPPGSYTVTASMEGFKPVTRTGLPLTVAQTATQDFKLEIGAVTQEVTVTAEAPLLEHATADRGGLVDAESVTEYPLNGRNAFMLASLVPGVNFNGSLAYQRPFDNGAAGNWDINGSNANNEFLLDGAPNTAQGINNYAYVPPVDSIQEFKIQTNAYDAQYGKSAGGIVNVALKSGGNRVHGTIYEFMRRDWLDCNSFQNNSRGAPKDGHYLDQYGLQLDGPLYIPKIYDGRNRTFFLFTYEGYREGSPQPLVLSVPEPEMRTGDFSKLVDANGRRITIYDPTTTNNATGTWLREPFPNNIIPASRVNAIARNIVGYFPEPNTRTAGVAYSQQNYFASGAANPARDDFYNLVFKFDQNIGSKHRTFFRHGSNDRSEMRSTNGLLGKIGADGPQPLQRINDAYVIDWVSTLSPTMIINPRVSFGRFVAKNDAVINKNFDMTTLGFPASLAASLPYSPGFGRYQMNEYMNLGKSNVAKDASNTWAAAVSFTKVSGTHTTKAGFDGRWTNFAVGTTGTVFQLTSNKVFTQLEYNRTNALHGNSVAGFLLGTPSGGTVNYNSFYMYLRPYYAPWVQHDWKATRRLTVNLGLRFDFNLAPTERFNRMNRGFDTESISPLEDVIDHAAHPDLVTPLRGGIRFAGVDGAPRTAADPYYNTWQPRIGLAYSLTPRTVIRGGWGRYYSNPNNDYHQSYGFNNQTTMRVSPDSNRTPFPNMLNDPFPHINLPRGAADGLLTYAGRSFNFVNTKFRTPHTDLFSFSIQRGIGERSRFEITYSGSRGYDQQSTKPFNEEDDSSIRDACNLMLGGNPSFCDAQVRNPWLNQEAFFGTNWYSQATLARNVLRRPFPQFNTFTEVMRNDGRSWYNSLQAVFNTRTRKGINLNVHYTFSKNMLRAGYLDAQNDIMQQGVTQYDRPHRFVTSMIAQLPFGKGKRWANHYGGVLGKLVSGWETTLMLNVQSGIPWALPDSPKVMYLKDARLPIDWNQEKILAVKPCVIRWNNNNTITTMPFSEDYGCTEPNWLIVPNHTPARFMPDYDARIRLQTVRMADFSLNKMTQITERVRAQFRAEAFNVTNSFFITRARFNAAADNANFGTIYKSAVSAPDSNYPRQIQLGFKLLW